MELYFVKRLWLGRRWESLVLPASLWVRWSLLKGRLALTWRALKQDRKMRGNFQSEGMNRGTRKRSEDRGLQQTAQNRRGQAHSQVSKVSARRMTKRRERFADLAEPRQLKIPQRKPILEKRTCSRRTERAGRIFYYMLSYSDFFFFLFF